LKITILQGAFLPVPPIQGGAVEKMWFTLGKEFVKRGHRVVHISKKHSSLPQEEVVNGVRHIRIKGYSTPSSQLKMKWLDLLYTIQSRNIIPDDTRIVITNTFWAPFLLKSVHRKRCIVDVQRMPKGQMRFYTKLLALRANSNIVAENIKKEISEKYYSKVFMVPNPLPFKQQPEVKFEDKQKKILYVGRLHPEKGIRLLIEGFGYIQTNWTLEIVGPWRTKLGGGGKKYLNRLKELSKKTPNNVNICDPIFKADLLNSRYREASIFVYPSLAEKGETFGLAPLEAMSFGAVPIVSELKCFKDFIKPGENGLIFNHRKNDKVALLAQKIKKLTEQNELRKKMAKQAVKVRDSHSVSNIAVQFLDHFERLVGENG